jgi:hypothetical protein
MHPVTIVAKQHRPVRPRTGPAQADRIKLSDSPLRARRPVKTDPNEIRPRSSLQAASATRGQIGGPLSWDRACSGSA